MMSAHDRIAEIQKELAQADESGDAGKMSMARQDAMVDLLGAILQELEAIRQRG
jgi:hypothetical protein